MNLQCWVGKGGAPVWSWVASGASAWWWACHHVVGGTTRKTGPRPAGRSNLDQGVRTASQRRLTVYYTAQHSTSEGSPLLHILYHIERMCGALWVHSTVHLYKQHTTISITCTCTCEVCVCVDYSVEYVYPLSIAQTTYIQYVRMYVHTYRLQDPVHLTTHAHTHTLLTFFIHGVGNLSAHTVSPGPPGLVLQEDWSCACCTAEVEGWMLFSLLHAYTFANCPNIALLLPSLEAHILALAIGCCRLSLRLSIIFRKCSSHSFCEA